MILEGGAFHSSVCTCWHVCR